MYTNLLMLYCRRTRSYTPHQAARLLGVTTVQYLDLESGNVLLDMAQARQLAKIYDSKADLFYEAAQQLDLLLSTRVVIKILKAENDRLRASLAK